MEQNLEDIQRLLTVFDERDRQKEICNRKIAEILTPSVLGALVELFNLPDENVVWHDFNVLESVLVIRAAVTYDPAHEHSHFLTLIAPTLPTGSPIQVQKMIQFGIPLAMVFKDREELKDWFMKVAQPDEPVPPPVKEQEQTTQFDGSQLTKDQLAQLLYFQRMHGDAQ